MSGYESRSWVQLRDELLSYYPAKDEDEVYRTKDLRRFVNEERKIKRCSDFDRYRRKFRVISLSLEERSHLIEIERDDYFFQGIKPKSFRKEVQEELRTQRLWTDLTRPPMMDHVVSIAKVLLKHDLYYDNKYNDSDMEDDNELDSKSEDSNDDSLSDQSEVMSAKSLCRQEAKSSKKSFIKKDTKLASQDVELDVPEVKSDLDPVSKSCMDDLANQISKLTIELTRLHEQPKTTPQASISEMWHCFMCKGEGHRVKDCPETKAFVAAGVLRYDLSNHLVMADGSRLPHARGRGLASMIWELADKRTSAANLEWA